jgi:hypothetical protein
MKVITGIALFLTLANSAQARETFAGIFLDSSMPAYQAQTLKNDLTYLYRLPNIESEEFKSLTQMSEVNGPHMYNWIYNRVKYILGEDFKLSGRNMVSKKGHVFPNTPLPPSIMKSEAYSYGALVVMSNVGAGMYLSGKRDKILEGVKINKKEILATSPRVGVLQVGEGLFSEKLLINKDLNTEANKVKRLGTLFHEARHGDGNSEHLGFLHLKCPSGHSLASFAACENSSNGAYSVGAVAMKTLLKECKTCSEVDKTKLQAAIADSFGRVVVRSHTKSEEEIHEEMEAFQRVINFYEDYLPKNPTDQGSIRELARLRAKMEELKAQLQEIRTPVEPKKLDPKPEGPYQDVSVERSSAIMKASLSR